MREWNIPNVRKEFRQGKVRDNEIEEDYFRIEQNFKSIEDFCQRPPFKFVVKRENTIKKYSDGPVIFYDDDKKRVCFERAEFYPVPKSIQKRNFKVNFKNEAEWIHVDHVVCVDYVDPCGFADPENRVDHIVCLDRVDYVDPCGPCSLCGLCGSV